MHCRSLGKQSGVCHRVALLPERARAAKDEAATGPHVVLQHTPCPLSLSRGGDLAPVPRPRPQQPEAPANLIHCGGALRQPLPKRAAHEGSQSLARAPSEPRPRIYIERV